ncbi:hypothetical protein B7494_g594 [Chlorociboria aeruginascens]|nr:hypothetical protein B7494_g594 [Chlorociboria aeruginascens]
MGVEPPFLYDPVRNESSFDPKAVSRASLTPKPRRVKQEGPLISFNQHPDSYLILPYGNTGAKPMNPSIKAKVKWTRIIQLALRCLELLAAPGIAILHTIYGVYHLARKSSGRTPASSASYMLFASFFDVSIIPFYAFDAWVSTTQTTWTIVLPNQQVNIFSRSVFFLAIVAGGLHLLSLGIGLYLAVTFRKITKLPPDMNPLEDNLTSRHKRNKSSVTTVNTYTNSEKRLSTPLENKRSSGAAYEDLARPPTIPFFHTRTGSTDSFSTYRSTPPPSRDPRAELPSRQYALDSARSSIVDLKRSSMGGAPPKRSSGASYSEISLSDTSSHPSSRQVEKIAEGWYASDSIGSRTRSSPQKLRQHIRGNYSPLPLQPQDHELNYDDENSGSTISSGLPNPLNANPPTPRHGYFPIRRESPLGEISHNTYKTRERGDIADMSSQIMSQSHPNSSDLERSETRDGFKAKYYGSLKPGTPPVMVGRDSNGNRQISSGNDYVMQGQVADGKGKGFRRDVSGKIVEEGRGGNGNGTWGTRFRKISGIRS